MARRPNASAVGCEPGWWVVSAAATAVALAIPGGAPAQVLLETFDGSSGVPYRTLAFTPGRDGAEFDFDYASVGIPEAPRTPAGAAPQRGLRLFANNPSGSTTGVNGAVQVIPSGIGGLIAGLDYSVSFDLWMNVNGPMPGGGGGSTEAFMAGVGWNGGFPIEAGTENGTYFTITGEGGSTTDIRSFTNDGFNAPGINLGPSDDTADPFYHGIFPGGTDLGLLPVQGGTDSQLGTTAPGQMAFSWHQVRLDVEGGSVSFSVDDLLIARDPEADRTGNIMVGYADYFSSVSDAPQWSFGLVDNLRIDLIPIPETATTIPVAAGLAGIVLRRRRNSPRTARPAPGP